MSPGFFLTVLLACGGLAADESKGGFADIVWWSLPSVAIRHDVVDTDGRLRLSREGVSVGRKIAFRDLAFTPFPDYAFLAIEWESGSPWRFSRRWGYECFYPILLFEEGRARLLRPQKAETALGVWSTASASLFHGEGYGGVSFEAGLAGGAMTRGAGGFPALRLVQVSVRYDRELTEGRSSVAASAGLLFPVG